MNHQGFSGASGEERNHLHTLNPWTALFLFGKIGFGWVHCFRDIHLELRKEEGGPSTESTHQSVRWQVLWCNRRYFIKLTASVRDFCILFSINGQKKSTHISLLMAQPGKTPHEVWFHKSTATQFDSYTNVNVFPSLWKPNFESGKPDLFSVSSRVHPLPLSSVKTTVPRSWEKKRQKITTLSEVFSPFIQTVVADIRAFSEAGRAGGWARARDVCAGCRHNFLLNQEIGGSKRG